MLMPRRSARSGTPPERSSASRVLATAEQRAARLFHRRAASRICMIVDAAKDPRVSKTCIKSTRTCKLQLEDRFSEHGISDLLIDF